MVTANLQLSVKPEQLTTMKTRFASEVLPDTRHYSGCSVLYMTENIDVPNQVEFVSIGASKEDYDTYLNWRDETRLLAEMADFTLKHAGTSYSQNSDGNLVATINWENR
ncbi:MAG: putative quinol monooxygenase [Pseudohongiellaceae bacterium]